MTKSKEGDSASVDAIVRRPFRFRSLLGGVIIAYPKESKLMAVVVRIDDNDELWDCYCRDVEFQSFTQDERFCRFVCNNRGFARDCRIIWPSSVTVQQISDAADLLYRR